ncbi:putative px domain-containing protein [Erysiphe neolycopersici]|uniref:Putative px domain-containing protein n=1 Tax=Erysiphe neolycopersici TaxID=212602 RepID=A0A420HPB1_9PEZI|nr:putative px domain-containing protein [Erysiphe neolycopersici]
MNETISDKKNDSSSGIEATINIPSPPYSSMTLEDITNYALQFLSVASPEAIVGVAVSLTTLTYFVLGRIGLILIGGVAGILLHANWEARGTEDHMSLRREKSIDVVRRILEIREQSTKTETYPVKDEIATCNFDNFQPETAAALRELVDAVIRDYVKWWYQKILPKDTAFVAAVRQSLSRIILSVSFHLSKKRPEDVFLDFLTNSSSIIIVFLGELSAALTLSPGPATDAVHSYLFANPESSLANALDEQNQKKKLKMTATDIMKNFVEKSILDCDLLKVFLTETLSSLVLESTLKTCSKPEWINGWIVFLLENGESDLSQVIDAGMDKNQQDGVLEESTENLGHAGLAQKSRSIQQEQEGSLKHNPLSIANDPIDEAFEEAKRLSELIAEDEAKKKNISQIFPKPIEELSDVPEGQTADNMDPPKMRSNSNKLSSKKDFKLMMTPEAYKVMDAPNLNSNNLEKSRVLPGSQEPSVPFHVSHSNSSLMRLDQINTDNSFGNRDISLQMDKKVTMVTLHNANVTLYDNNSNPEKGKMRSKPSFDFLIQIEPASSSHPGWMIVRRYPDFETLHEVLRRIAQISGVTIFTEQHQNLPSWKDSTKETLRVELERYLRDACWYQPLAESEGMKRFFKKDQEQQNPGSKNGFPGLGWSTPSAVGKGVLDALAGAPKGVAEGSKAITGVFNNIGNLGQKKPNGSQLEASLKKSSTVNVNSLQASRAGEDNYYSSCVGPTQSNKSHLEQRPGYDLMAMDIDVDLQGPESSSPSTRSSMSGRQSSDRNQDSTGYSSQRNTANSSPVEFTLDALNLPPPPTEMPDDYCSHSVSGSVTGHSRSGSNGASVRTTTGNIGTSRQTRSSSVRQSGKSLRSESVKTRKNRRVSKPLTEAETRVAVELIFAVINEMYTISSAWNIRRTLLTAAKTYFLRPGNPSLLQIQSLIQESVISVNTSDAGIAAHLQKIRENCLPTEDELNKCSTKMSLEDKERLRIKARRLLIKRGVPTALTGVMGQAATSEAMGHIFDCLQIEEVTRGLIFGVLLQGIRAVLY